MSANTDIVQEAQAKIADELLPAIKAAEMDTVTLVDEEIEIPQAAKGRLRAKVNQIKSSIISTLNQIGV